MKFKRTLLQKTIKFLWIIKYRKKQYIKFFAQACFRGVYVIISVVFIEKFTYFISINDIEAFNELLYIYWGIIVTYESLWYLTRKWWWVETLPQSQADLQKIFLDKYIRLNNTYVEKVGTWKLIWIITNGIDIWVEYLSIFIEKWIALIISLFFSFYLISKHWVLFLSLFFSILFLSAIVLVLINSYQFRFRSERYDINNENLRSTTKILMTKNEILQSGTFLFENDIIKKQFQRLEDVNKRMATWRFIQNRTIPFAVAILLLLVFAIYGKDVISGNLSISELVWMTSIMLVIQWIIYDFIGFYLIFTKKFINIEKMWDFFDSTPEIMWYDIWKDFKYKKGEIQIKNLSFSYLEWKNVFSDFSLNINWEKIIAFVWNSWSWKSTLIKLISWYISPNKGSIKIDGQNLSDISLKSYFSNIWYLSQEPSVFDGTILSNLTYALKKEQNKTILDKVIRDSKCEFIYDLPDWLNTEIWERGVRLSWGQRQRLAIAKIMLKNPKIILLDEPTSALDSFSEEIITKAMNNLFINRTVLVIAHRLQTVKHASRIIVLDNWNIVEDWDHKSLQKQKGIYYKMLELQSGF